jgi:hypothetical protein
MAYQYFSMPDPQCNKKNQARAAARRSVRPFDLLSCLDQAVDKIKHPPRAVVVRFGEMGDGWRTHRDPKRKRGKVFDPRSRFGFR